MLNEKNRDLPARLIDTKAFENGDEDVRLVEDVRKDWKYAAISYCWGEHRLMQKYPKEDKAGFANRWNLTTERSIGQQKERIRYKSLPKTIRDAIEIIRRLRIRYLWADCLCIYMY